MSEAGEHPPTSPGPSPVPPPPPSLPPHLINRRQPGRPSRGSQIKPKLAKCRRVESLGRSQPLWPWALTWLGFLRVPGSVHQGSLVPNQGPFQSCCRAGLPASLLDTFCRPSILETAAGRAFPNTPLSCHSLPVACCGSSAPVGESKLLLPEFLSRPRCLPSLSPTPTLRPLLC